MYVQVMPFAQTHLVSPGTATQYAWLTPWYSATGVDAVRAGIKVQNAGSGFQYQLAILTAAVRQDNPTSPQALGGTPYAGSQETCTGNINVASYTGSAMWF